MKPNMNEGRGLIHQTRSNENGIALILVLGVLAVLVIFATTFAFNMRLEQKAAYNYGTAIKVDMVTKAGIEHAIASMKIYAIEQAQMIYSDNWYYTSSSEPSFDEYNGDTDDGVTCVLDFGNGIIGTYSLKIMDTASQIYLNKGETTGGLDEVLDNLSGLSGQGTNIINYRNNLPDDIFITKEQVKETNGTVSGNYDSFKDFVAVNGYVNTRVCLASEGFTGSSYSYHALPSAWANSDWTNHSGTWNIEYGELNQSDTGAGTKILSYDYTEADNFTAIFKVKIVAGTSWAGFQFRKTNAGDDFDGTGYTVRFHQDGGIDIYDATDGIKDSEPATTISNTDVFHTIKITANGSQLDVYIDGGSSATLSATDTSYSNGYMAFITEGNVHAHFDSFEAMTSLAPVCVNTASRDVLVAVMEDLSDGTDTVSQAEAETAADAIITYTKTGPNTIKTWAGFDSIIDGTGLGAPEKKIIKTNANPNIGINLSTYSVPFCFHGSGYYEIECTARVGRDGGGTKPLGDSADEIYAEKKIRAIVKISDIWYSGTQEDFDNGATTAYCDMRAFPGLVQIAAQNMWIEAENYTTSGNADDTLPPITPHPSGSASNDCTVQNSDDVQIPAVDPNNYFEWDDIGISDIGDYDPSTPTAAKTCYLRERTYWDNESATIKLSYDSGTVYFAEISPGVSGDFEWSASGAGAPLTTKNHDVKITAVDLTVDALAASSAIYALEPDVLLVTLENGYTPVAADIADGSYDDPNYYGTITFESANSPTIDISAGDKWGAILFTEDVAVGETVAVKTENGGGGETSGAYTNGGEIDSNLDDNDTIRVQIELTRGGAAGAWTTPGVDDVIITYVPRTKILYWAEEY